MYKNEFENIEANEEKEAFVNEEEVEKKFFRLKRWKKQFVNEQLEELYEKRVSNKLDFDSMETIFKYLIVIIFNSFLFLNNVNFSKILPVVTLLIFQIWFFIDFPLNWMHGVCLSAFVLLALSYVALSIIKRKRMFANFTTAVVGIFTFILFLF
jgi:hypothetical protein